MLHFSLTLYLLLINFRVKIVLFRGTNRTFVPKTTKQASPATYEIQQDGSQYFITTASKRLYIDYDPAKDVLNISSLGDYLRN